jgi:fatty acid desaturase
MNRPGSRASIVLCVAAITATLYFAIQRTLWFAATTVPATALDRALPFVPIFVVPYLSFFLLILTPLLVIEDRRGFRDVAIGFALIVVASSVAFLFWPTQIPFERTDPALRMLLALDGSRNACPSLHASLSIYCALAASRCMERANARRALWLWTIVVLVAPLLIKRHAAIDIAAGAALGWAMGTAILRRDRDEAPDSEPVVETLRIRRRLAGGASTAFAALTRYDRRKRLHELMAFVALAALGLAISLWARAAGSTLMLTAGILTTAVALNTFPLLMHEGMHGILFASRRWNWLVSVALGSTFLLSFTAYRVMHLRHHRYLGDPRDPDDYHNYSGNRFVVWSLHFVRLTLGPLLYLVLIPVMAIKYGSRAQRKLVCVEYVILAAVYSCLLRAFPARELLVVWLVPLLLMGAMTAIRGFTQHGITEATDPYLASRTMLPHPVVAFFLLNENYHLEHHLFPEVPSYHLPALHRLIWPQLPRAVSGRSYLAFLGAFLKATPRMDETPIGRVTRDGHTP